MGKPKIIKNYDKLDEGLREQIKLKFPWGYEEHLIKFMDKDGRENLALPFETDEFGYMIRMTVSEARKIIAADDDFDDSGVLKEDVLSDLKDEYLDTE